MKIKNFLFLLMFVKIILSFTINLDSDILYYNFTLNLGNQNISNCIFRLGNGKSIFTKDEYCKNINCYSSKGKKPIKEEEEEFIYYDFSGKGKVYNDIVSISNINFGNIDFIYDKVYEPKRISSKVYSGIFFLSFEKIDYLKENNIIKDKIIIIKKNKNKRDNHIITIGEKYDKSQFKYYDSCILNNGTTQCTLKKIFKIYEPFNLKNGEVEINIPIEFSMTDKRYDFIGPIGQINDLIFKMQKIGGKCNYCYNGKAFCYSSYENKFYFVFGNKGFYIYSFECNCNNTFDKIKIGGKFYDNFDTYIDLDKNIVYFNNDISSFRDIPFFNILYYWNYIFFGIVIVVLILAFYIRHKLINKNNLIIDKELDERLN